MAITPKEVTIQEIFSNTKYNVDFYQREYKWNDKMDYKPVSSLLGDIFFRFELDYKSSDYVSQEVVDNYNFYYLNSFMINRVDGKTYIVDGQQRLTTLTLICIMLHKRGKELGASEGTLSSIQQKICQYDMLGNYTYWMGFDDRELALDTVMRNSVDELKEIDTSDATISQKNIYEACPIIYNIIEKKIDSLHKFQLFLLYFFSRITLIQIDVIDTKDVAMTFEVINDRGVPLKAYEILKGKLVGSLDKSEQRIYAEKWDDNVGPLMDLDGKNDETDSFFSWYFQSKYPRNYDEHKSLGKQYHKAIFMEPFVDRIGFKDKGGDSHKSRIKDFIDHDLPYFSKLYVRMHENKKDETKGEYLWFCFANGQNTSIHNLMMSCISYNDKQIEEKYNLVPKLFDKLYTILMLTGSYDSSAFVPSMSELSQKIRDEKSLDAITLAFDNEIKRIIRNKKNKDAIEDIYAPALYENAGYSLGSGFLRYFFGRIDHYLSEEMQLPTVTYHGLIKQNQGNTIYHVEHILSRNEQNIGWFRDEDEYEDYRNKLGALVLLKGPDNQSSGNEVYDDKLKTYLNVGSLWSKTLVPSFCHSNTGLKHFSERTGLEFNTYNKYGVDEIKERTSLLLKLIKIIW